MIRQLEEELNFNKKEVQILRAEKDSMETVLTIKGQELKKNLGHELLKNEEEMKRHGVNQKAENLRMQQMITSFNNDMTSMKQQLLGLNRRIAELEIQMGHDEHN